MDLKETCPDDDAWIVSNRPDDRVVDERVRENLPLVGYVVHEVAGRLPGHVAREDLVSAGMAGLAQAALSFDPSNGVPFTRHASTRIKGAILDELRSMDWASRGARSRGRELAQAQEKVTARLGRTPTTADLADELRLEVSELDRRRAESERSLLSLDAFDGSVADSLPDSAPDPQERLLAKERVGYLHAALASLPERLRLVAVGVYLEQRPMAEIAAELGVTESRVSQLRSEALVMLRDAVNSQLDPERVPAQPNPDGIVARRREALYAQVAAHAAAAGLGPRTPVAHPYAAQHSAHQPASPMSPTTAGIPSQGRLTSFSRTA